MEEKKELANCATCVHNVRNYCKSSFGYYFRGETIIDELVPCDDWERGTNSFLSKLEEKQIIRERLKK